MSELARLHRTRLIGLRAAMLLRVAQAWGTLFEAARAEETLAMLGGFLGVLVTGGQAAATADTANYLRASLAQAAGVPALDMAPTVQPFGLVGNSAGGRPLAALSAGLPAWYRNRINNGLSADVAAAQALAYANRMAASEPFRVAAATVTQTADGDDRFTGRVNRITAPGACKFCVLIHDRGYIPATAGFDAHANCRCTPEPEISARVYGRRAQARARAAERGDDTSGTGQGASNEPDDEFRVRPRLPLDEQFLAGLAPPVADFLRFVDDVYGERFVLEDWSENVYSNVAQLRRIPRTIHGRVANWLRTRGPGAGIYLGDRAVPYLDELSYLADQHPRGWQPGSTWRDVPGAFVPSYDKLAIGKGDHGSGSLARHEYGHLVDKALNPHPGTGALSSTAWFRSVYDTVVDEATRPIRGYYLQSGNAGRSEMFAEAFAAYNTSPTMRASALHDLARSQKGAQALSDFFDELFAA